MKEARLAAMLAAENALVVMARSGNITPEMDRCFDRYNKLKGHVMNESGNVNENNQAFKLAMVELIKTVF
jgi:hypothetical protein